jgi:hypothetical protein
MEPGAQQVVFHGDCLRAVCYGAGARGIIVTFDHWRKQRTGFPELGPVQRAIDMGYRSLVIASGANDWFINVETAALQAALRAFVPWGTVVRAFGFSMGGYGALLFSAALRVQSVVLFAPQVSIRAAVVPFETRWRAEAARMDARQDRLADLVKRDVRGVVLYDPRYTAAEVLQARAVQEIVPGVQLAAVPFSGHPPTAMLMAGKAYGGLMKQGISGVVTAGDVRQLHRKHREVTPAYLEGVLGYLRGRGVTGADLI